MDPRPTFGGDSDSPAAAKAHCGDAQDQASLLTHAQFEERFERSRATLWCIAAAVIGSRERAEDVLQDAAVIALTKLEQFDPNTSFTAWMGQIVRFTALNHRRREFSKPIAIGADPDLSQAQPASSPMAVDARGVLTVDQTSFDDEVLAALNTLESTPRACLLLRIVREMSYKEIARALDVPEGTAMSHVHRGRATLRRALSEQHAKTQS